MPLSLERRRTRYTTQRTFSPLHVAGFGAGYNAKYVDGFPTGNPMNTWPDLGGRYLATQTGGNRPTYTAAAINGYPAVGFAAASSQYMMLDALAPFVAGSDIPYTIVAAAYPTDVTANRTFFSFGVSTVGEFSTHRVNATTGAQVMARTSDAGGTSASVVSGTSSGTSPHVYTSVFKGTTATLRVDGVETNTDGALDVNAIAFDLATIGALRRNTVSAFWEGYIGIVLIYLRALSTWECARLERYCGREYSIPMAA